MFHPAITTGVRCILALEFETGVVFITAEMQQDSNTGEHTTVQALRHCVHRTVHGMYFVL